MTLTRFAPSPTGYLHRGHARAAAEAFGFGPCLLRIEDIDHTRCRPEYTSAIYEDLRWLGFEWPMPVRVQSDHRAEYARVVAYLMCEGLAYTCPLSRSDLKRGQRTAPARATPDQIESVLQTAETESPMLTAAVRLNLAAVMKNVSERLLTYKETGTGTPETQDVKPILYDWIKSDRPDPILARRDIACSYIIAATHDDHAQEITHVVRGADLIAETALQVLLQKLMGWTTPTYHHHALVLGEDGRKLSKTAKDETIRSLRTAGLTKAEVLRGEVGLAT